MHTPLFNVSKGKLQNTRFTCCNAIEVDGKRTYSIEQIFWRIDAKKSSVVQPIAVFGTDSLPSCLSLLQPSKRLADDFLLTKRSKLTF